MHGPSEFYQVTQYLYPDLEQVAAAGPDIIDLTPSLVLVGKGRRTPPTRVPVMEIPDGELPVEEETLSSAD